MRAILSAPGSRGDVNPMIAIGRQLRRLGFEVVISIAEPYADIARAADLHVEPVIGRDRFDQLLSNPHVWKPVRGARVILRQIAAEFLPLHDEVIRRHHRPGETVLVSHPLDFASRVHRDADPSTPLVNVHLAPSILRTYDCPPRLSPWWFEVSRPAWAVRATYLLADLLAVDPLVRTPVNRLRAAYGLPPVRRILNRWWLSPDRIVAMYPNWFAPATRGFCPQLVHAGFPLSDADDSPFDPPAERPIVFTAGTAHHHCADFFESAVAACQSLRRPGLLMSSYPNNFPQNLPPWIQTASYVSFRKLLPHCSVIVHHGGIGTTSQALAAGAAQVVRPLAFDQFDNATRVEQLGCGVWLRNDSQLTRKLGEVLDSETVRANCRAIASRFGETDAAATAANIIQETVDP